ncbi:hypothetical protein LTR36_010682 [Oleoguttula mirabilis]|uniref:Uncharacterized protein n=1 Tax=Oleoguttula mirabilis TaxID=1507867 RepID=A0AAV9JR33_9PEZI|nr:hypothetical protein LTR36_010682 [Oleoguttula mirabilis]
MVKKRYVAATLACIAWIVLANPSAHAGSSAVLPILTLPACNDTSGIQSLDQVSGQHAAAASYMKQQIPWQQHLLDHSRDRLPEACRKAKTARIAGEQVFVNSAAAFASQARNFRERLTTEFCLPSEVVGGWVVGDDKQAREKAFGEVYNRHEELLAAFRMAYVHDPWLEGWLDGNRKQKW